MSLTRRWRTRTARLASTAALLVGVAACVSSGSDASSGSGAASSSSAVGAPTSAVGSSLPAADTAASLPVDDVERRIVPLNGDVAEIVFALGLGDEVVATDLSATYPAEAESLPKFGFERALNTEPILEFEPTVVVGTDAAGPQDTIDDLARVAVPVTIIEREFSPTGPAAKIRQVADALGETARGEELASTVQAEIDDATVTADEYTTPLKVAAIYLRGAELQFVLGEGSGIDWIITAAGAVDVADELGISETSPITSEALLAVAPDAIIVPADGLRSAGGVEALLAIPGIAETPAGRRGAIYAYDDQLMLGNGPRTGQFLAQLVDDLRAADRLRTSTPNDTTNDTTNGS